MAIQDSFSWQSRSCHGIEKRQLIYDEGDVYAKRMLIGQIPLNIL